jgi:hypothetical protein
VRPPWKGLHLTADLDGCRCVSSEAGQVRSSIRSLQHTFRIVPPCGLHIPLYGAYRGLAVASDELGPLPPSPLELADRFLQRRAIPGLRSHNRRCTRACSPCPTSIAN